MAENKTYGTRAVASPHNHQVYECYIKSLGLKDSERLDLRKRGLNEQQIMAAQYATKGINTSLDTNNALGALVSIGLNLDDVAGFHVDDKGHPEQSKVSGLMIPVRDYNGHIASLLIRNDKAKVGKDGKIQNKYLPFSSAGKTKGNKVRQTTHCPIIKGAAIKQDSTIIRITEGVLKADVATALDDIYTLGMQGLKIQDDLAVIITELEIQTMLIAIDAGEDKNIDVIRCKANLIKLAGTLGIDFKLEIWDAMYGKGIDDVLSNKHKDKVRFATDEEADLILEAANECDPNNGEWVYCTQDQSFISKETHQMWNKSQFVDEFRLEKVEFANKLIAGGFEKVSKTSFLPAGDEFIMEDGVRCLNMWVKPSLVPWEGDVQPLLDHINYLFPDELQQGILLDFLAFCIQRQGIKILWALVIIGDEGIGKSFFGFLMKQFLGEKNVGTPANETLHEPYTDWQKNKSLIVIEELFAGGKAELMNKLKPIITQPTTQIRQMHRTAYEAVNRFNLLGFTNHDDPLLLSDKDRRWGVIKTEALLQSPEYYEGLWNWAREIKNLQAMLFFFMQRDMSKFNPNAKAPMTSAKQDIIGMSLNRHEAWMKTCLEERAWPFNRDIIVTRHVKLRQHCPVGFEALSDHKIAIMFKKFGGIQYEHLIVMADKSKARPWLIGDNKHILAKLSPPELVKIYEADGLNLKPDDPVSNSKFENNVLGFSVEKNPIKDDEPF